MCSGIAAPVFAPKYLAYRRSSCYNLAQEAERKFAMKTRFLTLLLAFDLFLTPLGVLPCLAAIVTFDEFPASANGTLIPNGYQSLNWSNFAVGNGILLSNSVGYANGYYYGIVSTSNVAVNAGGIPAEIDARGTNFNFFSVYLTGAWNSNLNIQVEGFRGGTLIYDRTVVAAAMSATPFTFNYLDVDRLYFNSYGGEPAFGPNNDETHFVMDNFMFEFIPEPSSFLLAALGAVSLVAFLRRKHA
jgi:hypothetical protein